MTYGEETAQRIWAENPAIVAAALFYGDAAALRALLSLAATTGYTDGMSAAARTVGFPL